MSERDESELDYEHDTIVREDAVPNMNSTSIRVDGSPHNQPSGSRVVNEDIDREREFLRRERELLERERQLLQREKTFLNESTFDRTAGGGLLAGRDLAERLLPDFDPSKITGFTTERWIQRVEGVAKAYGWSNAMLLAHVVPKLRGAAKQWVECNLEDISTWENFKARLIRSFPSQMDQADIHLALTKRKKGRDETYEEYVFAMKALACRGEIRDDSLIKYVINGLYNRDMVNVLAMQEFQDVDDFLNKIRKYEGMIGRNNQVLPERGTSSREGSFKRSYVGSGKTSTEVKCFNCSELGHYASRCPRTQKSRRSCFSCGSDGHLAATCPKKREVKKVNKFKRERE